MLQKEKKGKEKKWRNVPKVPSIFWRTSVPVEDFTYGPEEDEKPRKAASLDAKEAARAKLVISNPRPLSSTYVPSKTLEPIEIETPREESLYVNQEVENTRHEELCTASKTDEPANAIYSEPIRRRSVSKAFASLTETKVAPGIPNISFSFFNDRKGTSSTEPTTPSDGQDAEFAADSLEVVPETNLQHDAKEDENKTKLKQSSILLEVRRDDCDGSSSDNVKYIVSSCSDNLRNVYIEGDNADDDYAILKISEDTETKMYDKTRDSLKMEDTYASPRNSRGYSSAPASVLPLNGVTGIPDNIASGIFSFPSSPPSPEQEDGDSSLQYDCDYTYYELSHCGKVALSNSSTLPDDATDRDYEDLEYCEHRAKDPRNRRATLIRGKSRTRVVRARSRIGRAWRAVRVWWNDEKGRIEEVIQKHAHAQAVQQPESEEAKSADNVNNEGEEEIGEGEEKNNDENEKNVSECRIIKRRRRSNSKEGSRPTSKVVPRRSKYIAEGQSGFEELRRYIKQGGDFCKDLSSILQERSEAETQYAKSLSKLSGKLLKASKDSVGTVNQAWQKVGAQMEVQSEIHRAFAAALSEEVVKPLKQLVESQHRIRKSVESAVEKTSKGLADWRTAEAKSKKQSFVSARENEKLQDAMLDVRLGRSSSMHHLHHIQNQKTVSDKECAKLESKRRKAEESVKKADVEYYTFCIRAERARLEWETAVIRGSHCFQALEEERLQHLKDLASCYLHHLSDMGPKLVQSTERLSEPVNSCDIARDIQTVVSIKGTGQPIPEQLLPDFYAEHITLAMNRERRRQALMKVLQLIRQDLDRERRGKQGVENLARALQQTPTFGAEDSQQNVTEKLHHMRSMLTYLEAARYKVQSALAELDGRTRNSHPLASHIEVTRDRQGLQQSILKVPPWVRKESVDLLAGDSPDWTDRGAADGNSVQPDSDFDEFSSQGSEKDYQSSIMTYPVISECGEANGTNIGRCKVLYQYSANLYDELSLSPGDVINIHNKQADGWWLGELNGVVGIFPATYVEEIK